MTSIFLREVHLKDFRTFGDFTLPIAPGPGLTLLVGTNGLGKSTFFDGIEWCLTGAVKRFDEYVGRLKEGDYLTRRDADPGTHQVRLQFSEDGPLTRTLHQHPSDAALGNILKDPQWTQIKDMATYLGFTHFLGQASQQRFTSRDRSDQWQALKGPSGVDRLESVRTRLRGRATTLAFTRRLEREGLDLSAAMKELDSWRASVTKLADLNARARAWGAESEQVIEARLASIEHALFPSVVRETEFTGRIAIARSFLDARTRDLAAGRASIGEIEAIVARFKAASLREEADERRLAVVRSIVTNMTAEVSEAMLVAGKAEREAADQSATVTRAEVDRDAYMRKRSAIAELSVLVSERDSARSDEAAVREQITSHHVEIATAQADLVRVNAWEQELNRIDGQISTLQQWSERSLALASLEDNARALRDVASNALEIAGVARSNMPELLRSFDYAKRLEEAADARLATRRQNATQLAELLSELTSHIAHDDLRCPVCTTDFPEGVLQQRARHALSVQDLQLAEEVHSLEALRHRTGEASRAAIQAQHAVDFADEAVSAADVAERTVGTERSTIREHLGVSPKDDVGAYIQNRLTEVVASRVRHIQSLHDFAAKGDEIRIHLDALQASLSSLEDRLARSVQRRSRCDIEIAPLEDALADLPESWKAEDIDRKLEATRAELDVAQERFQKAIVSRSEATNSEAAAKERLAAAQAEALRVAEAIRESSVVRLGAISDWHVAGMDGEPSPQAVVDLQASLHEQGVVLASNLDQIDSLSKSYEALIAQHELRDHRAYMSATAGPGAPDDPVPYEAELQAKLQSSRDALHLTTSARDAVVAYGDQLKSEVENFSTQFLLPLNDLIDGFNRALLSTPGETVQFNASHTVERTSLAMQLRYADPIDNAKYKTSLPPQLVLSEGQMAANGFSILCAASTAYRWSRWRALLLDDPLQHNDIIHAAAFVDVMRNLVEDEGYQLIMSSHKRDEGEFIARKFDAAGLPCTVVELIGMSRSGVQVAPPRHNAAARRLLGGSEARVAQ